VVKTLQLVVVGVVITVWAAAWIGGIFVDRALIDPATTLNKPAFAVIGFILGREGLEVFGQLLAARKDTP
jgi:hypothetical protein